MFYHFDKLWKTSKTMFKLTSSKEDGKNVLKVEPRNELVRQLGNKLWSTKTIEVRR